MRTRTWAFGSLGGLAALIAGIGAPAADNTKAAYPAMAPISQYLMANRADEVALARSAAPASISEGAEILTLSSHGYETAAKGKNGFVCFAGGPGRPALTILSSGIPELRSPLCLNAAAVRTVLPAYDERTKWALAGVSREDMLARTKAEVAANKFTLPAAGAMSYMMSKQGYLGRRGGTLASACHVLRCTHR